MVLFDDKDNSRYIVVGLHELPFYLQLGFLVPSMVIEEFFNTERIEDFVFKDEFQVYGCIEDIPTSNNEVILTIGTEAPIRGNMTALHISHIREVLCRESDFDRVSYTLESNELAFHIECRSTAFPETGTEGKPTGRISFQTSHTSKDYRRFSNGLRVKGGIALVLSIMKHIGDITWLNVVLDNADSFHGSLFEEGMPSRILVSGFQKGLMDSDQTIALFNKYIKKQYGGSSSRLLDILADKDQEDNVIGMFEQTKAIKQVGSRLSYLEIAFLNRKFNKLKNVISRDLESALSEVLYAHGIGYLDDTDVVRNIFLLGYFTGYPSLYNMIPLVVQNRMEILPRLDDLHGLGKELDRSLFGGYIDIAGNTQMASKELKASIGIFSKPGSIPPGEKETADYGSMISIIRENPQLHKELAIIHSLFLKVIENNPRGFFERLEQIVAKYHSHEPTLIGSLSENIKNGTLSNQDRIFLAFTSEILSCRYSEE